MDQYNKIKQSETENFAETWLKKEGFDAKRNNLVDQTKVDLLVNGKKVDVQFSNDFAQYGDIRIDLISAGFESNVFEEIESNFLNLVQENKDMKISKPGKFFQKGYAEYVFYLVYDNKLRINSLEKLENFPEKILVLNVKEVSEYIEKKGATFLNRVKINDKRRNDIKEEHISAFLPLSLRKELFKVSTMYSYYEINKLNRNYDLISGKKLSDIFI